MRTYHEPPKYVKVRGYIFSSSGTRGTGRTQKLGTAGLQCVFLWLDFKIYNFKYSNVLYIGRIQKKHIFYLYNNLFLKFHNHLFLYRMFQMKKYL